MPHTLSGFQIMWMYVMFDLPTNTKKERKQAHDFRVCLLDLGFEMVQYSVYAKYCSGKEKMEALSRKVSTNLPAGGKVDILSITDRQYENIKSYEAKSVRPRKKNEQLALL